MANIRIDDLPPGESPTPQELDEAVGTGRSDTRPAAAPDILSLLGAGAAPPPDAPPSLPLEQMVALAMRFLVEQGAVPAGIRIEDLPGVCPDAEQTVEVFGAGRPLAPDQSLDLWAWLGTDSNRTASELAAHRDSPAASRIPNQSSTSDLPFLPAKTAAEVCDSFRVRQTARALLEQGMPPLALLDRLVAQESLYPDALDFLAHAVERRHAVWWGCLCVWLVARSTLSLAERRALAAAVAWALDPSEANRKQAQALAAPVADRGPGRLAAAVGATGGSMLPEGQPPVAPPPSLTGDYLAGALQLTATLAGLDAVMMTYRRFIGLGIRIAQGHYTPKKDRPGSAKEKHFWPGQA